MSRSASAAPRSPATIEKRMNRSVFFPAAEKTLAFVNRVEWIVSIVIAYHRQTRVHACVLRAIPAALPMRAARAVRRDYEYRYSRTSAYRSPADPSTGRSPKRAPQHVMKSAPGGHAPTPGIITMSSTPIRQNGRGPNRAGSDSSSLRRVGFFWTRAIASGAWQHLCCNILAGQARPLEGVTP